MAYRDIYGERGSPTGNALYSLTAPSFKASPGSRLPTQPPIGAVDATASTGTIGQTDPAMSGGIPLPDPAAAAPAAGAADPAAALQTQTPEEDLAKWGYTGQIPINNLEQQAIDFVNNLYSSGGGLETMSGAQDYYNKVLAGEFGPEGQAYLQSVLDPMRASSERDYNDMSKALATKFSQYGGFFGGRHGVGQGRLAAESANNMALNEANLRYQRFSDNMNQMGGAAAGLQSLGQAQSGVSGDMLNYLLSTGGMVTDRDRMNRAEYQNALQRSYEDWVRARSERLMPISMGANMVGTSATQPIVTQQQSPWGAALGAFGQIGAAAIPW